MKWDKDIKNFLLLCEQEHVKMILVGGGAVNFHGYQRHSADLDFWIDLKPNNLEALKRVLDKLDYQFKSFPTKV